MTTSEKVVAVTVAAIQHHAIFLDDLNVAVRSVSIRIRITASGDPQAVLVNFESEQTYNPGDRRGMPGGPPLSPTLAGARPPTPTMGRKE